MLILGREQGKQVLIGDHSLITVVSVEPGGFVNLGFETADQVRRVDSPKLVVAAAKAKARVIRAYQAGDEPMAELPVQVGFRVFETGEVDLRASLRQELVDVAGYRLTQVTSETKLAPRHHEFVVVRCAQLAQVEAIRALVAAELLDWRYYETVEQEDGTFYALFVRTTLDKRGDVRYVDLLRSPQ